MGRPAIDLTGQRYGLLTVVARANAAGARADANWSCRCDCGATINVFGFRLKSGGTTSCGCRRRESFIATMAAARETYNAMRATPEQIEARKQRKRDQTRRWKADKRRAERGEGLTGWPFVVDASAASALAAALGYSAQPIPAWRARAHYLLDDEA